MLNRLTELSSVLKELKLLKHSNMVNDLIKKSAETYTVKPGDTLSGIAGGDPQFLKKIKDENPDIDPDSLQVGDEIIIPDRPKKPNKSMKYSPSLVEFIKNHEGSRKSKGEPILRAYDDGFGNITIGWGHKLLPGESYSKINKNQAEELLRADLKKAADFIRNNVKQRLSQSQFDALVSLVFNAGRTAVYKSNLFKVLNSGDLIRASRLFPTTLIGKNQKGLQQRRQKESAMFKGGVGTY